MGNEFFAMMAFLIVPLFGPFSAMIFGIDTFFVKSLAIGIWDGDHGVEYRLDSHFFFFFFGLEYNPTNDKPQL